IFKSIRMPFLLPFHSDHSAYIDAGNPHYFDFFVRVNFISFARGGFDDVVFFGLILNALGTDAPAFEVIQFGLFIKGHGLISRIAAAGTQPLDHTPLAGDGLATFLYRGLRLTQQDYGIHVVRIRFGGLLGGGAQPVRDGSAGAAGTDTEQKDQKRSANY